MKYFALFSLIVCGPSLAWCQDSINPYVIHQRGNLILQNTDVYYNPFAPPGDSDTREKLSNESDIYQDPNGVGDGAYVPIIYDSVARKFDTLANWAPHGTPIGPYTTWQRLFQSNGDIIAGSNVTTDTAKTHGYGPVIISKNEDVDFRARGTIKLESGFHARAGCFFHAYTEPKFDTAVFSDEFDDTAKFRSHWFIYNGHSGVSGVSIPQAEYDSNVALVTDPDAHDGHALDIRFRVNIDTFSCDSIIEYGGCSDSVWLDGTTRLPQIHKSLTSTGYIRTCPFNGLMYDHAPYGKVEIRDKVPNMYHHTNNWGGPGEWDLDERWNDQDGIAHPNWGHQLTFGPCHGFFKIIGTAPGDTLFISYDDTAMYSAYQPTATADYMILGGVGYGITNWANHKNFIKDTFNAAPGSPFPSSLATSSDTFTYYYSCWRHLNSDSVTWSVTKASDSSYRIFHAPYHIRSGDSILFTKEYQPVQLILSDSVDIGGFKHQKTYHCHWLASLNSPNKGIIYLDDALDSADLKTNTEQFGYVLTDAYAGAAYPIPPVVVGADTANPDPPSDSAAFVAQPYQYHTYSMEFLPHEVRILYDSVVVRRIPDRLIPPGSPYYDWVGTLGRTGLTILPGEFDGDDVLAAPSGDANHELNYFLTHSGNPGFWNGAAHHLLDYVKVWDVPKDIIIPGFPK